MNFTDILTWVILLIFVYLIYLWFFGGNSSSTLSRLHDATQSLSINPSEIPATPSSNFSFSICYYLDDWNYKFGEKKVIFDRQTSDICGTNDDKDKQQTFCSSPKIEFDATVNDIIITLATFPQDATNEGSPQATPETLVINNVPLQKWTSLILTVHGRAMDVYLDGKLVNTLILTHPPKMNSTHSLTLTPDGGFSGSTANFLYHPKSLNPRDAYNLYKEGCGSTSWLGSLFNRYRLKLAFLRDNQEINSFEI